MRGSGVWYKWGGNLVFLSKLRCLFRGYQWVEYLYDPLCKDEVSSRACFFCTLSKEHSRQCFISFPMAMGYLEIYIYHVGFSKWSDNIPYPMYFWSRGAENAVLRLHKVLGIIAYLAYVKCPCFQCSI